MVGSVEKEGLDKRIQKTRTRGELMGGYLGQIFESFGFSPQLLKEFGVICLDVDFGQEIVALKPYQPKLIIVSEGWPKERSLKEGVIRELGEGLDVRVIWEYPRTALNQIKEGSPEAQFALITFLNIFPENSAPSYLTQLIAESASLLVPGGLLVISSQENDIDTQMRLEKTAKGQIADLEIDYLQTPRFPALGFCFIVAKKT